MAGIGGLGGGHLLELGIRYCSISILLLKDWKGFKVFKLIRWGLLGLIFG